MFRGLLILVAFLVSHTVSAASIKPQVPPNERAIYAEMLKTNPTAAKEYLITREYVSAGRQVVANPKLASDFPDEPDDFKSRYVSKDEAEILKKAIKLSLEAYIASEEKKAGRR